MLFCLVGADGGFAGLQRLRFVWWLSFTVLPLFSLLLPPPRLEVLHLPLFLLLPLLPLLLLLRHTGTRREGPR